MTDHICPKPGCGMLEERVLVERLTTSHDEHYIYECPRNADAHALCKRVAELEHEVWVAQEGKKQWEFTSNQHFYRTEKLEVELKRARQDALEYAWSLIDNACANGEISIGREQAFRIRDCIRSGGTP